MAREDLMKNSRFLENLNLTGEKSPQKESVAAREPASESSAPPVKQTPDAVEKSPKTAKKAVAESGAGGKRITLEVASDKRRTAGFHIFPEYEKAIDTLMLLGRFKNKGKALEYLVDFYLTNLPEGKRKEFLKLMGAEEQEGEW